MVIYFDAFGRDLEFNVLRGDGGKNVREESKGKDDTDEEKFFHEKKDDAKKKGNGGDGGVVFAITSFVWSGRSSPAD